MELESLWSLLSNVFIRRNEADSRVWKPKPSSSFSSKSFYKAMESTVLVHSSCSQVWLGIVPPRVKAFCWLAVTCKISMANNLRRRGFSSEAFSTMCYFCGREEESINHLFLHCDFASSLWGIFLKHCNVAWCLPGSLGNLVDV